MGFCTKCGTKLNDGDLFCPNCGNRVEREEEIKQNYYGDINNFPTKQSVAPVVDNSNRAHPLAKSGLILSIVSIALIVIGFGLAFVAVALQDRGIYITTVLGMLFGMIGCVVSLGISIPGFVITKKRGYAKGVAIAALVLSIICVSVLLCFYVYSEATSTVY